jgi:DNA repair exonuclease SbcCD nuclease subunit
MKVLAFSDIHLDAVTAGRARRAEVIAFLDRAWMIAHDEKVDIVIFAGDAHDPGSQLDSMYAADLIRHFYKFKQTFIGIAGNHDVLDTSELFLGQPITTLTPLRSVRASLSNERTECMHIFDRPHSYVVEPGWAVLALPYVSRAHGAKRAEWLAVALEEAAKYKAAGLELIVVAHLVIPGARMSSESTEMAKGQDQLFPFEEVDRLKPALVINGHYHARQVLERDILLERPTIVIPGSPVRFTFGESPEVNKGVLLWQS